MLGREVAESSFSCFVVSSVSSTDIRGENLVVTSRSLRSRTSSKFVLLMAI